MIRAALYITDKTSLLIFRKSQEVKRKILTFFLAHVLFKMVVINLSGTRIFLR